MLAPVRDVLAPRSSGASDARVLAPKGPLPTQSAAGPLPYNVAGGVLAPGVPLMPWEAAACGIDWMLLAAAGAPLTLASSPREG